MALTFKAVFGQVTKSAPAVATLADDLTDTITNEVLIVTAGSDGALVSGLHAIPRATLTATRIDLFISTDSGATKQYINSALMGAHTVAATTEVPKTYFLDGNDLPYGEDNPLRIPASAELYVGIAVAGDIAFFVQATDF